MQRAQLVLAVASATRYFVPSLSSAGVPVAMPAPAVLDAAPAALALSPPLQRVATPQSGFGVETVAAFALAGVAGVAATVSLRAARPSMMADEAAEEAAEEDPPVVAAPEPEAAPVAAPSAPSGVLVMQGIGAETGGSLWDPLDLANLGSEKTLAWFRHAEIKHGRVAMAAMVGFLVHINHIHFPGEIGQGVTFESLSQMGPFEAWSGIPMLGQAQILFAIAGLEWNSESRDPKGHYMVPNGGTPGDLKFLKSFWDPVGFTAKLSPEELARKREAELKNGRLAMIGIMSIVAATAIPGSVPLMADAPALTGPALVLPLLSTA